MTSNKFDVIIIGGGHNGLVTAVYLAKAGRKVLLLEQRETLGGAAATEAVFPGFKVNTGAGDAGLFSSKIVSDLNLTQHGLTFIESPVITHTLQPGGNGLTLWRDPTKTAQEIMRFSLADAVNYPKFVKHVHRMAAVMQTMLTRTPPTLPNYNFGELWTWANVALKLKRLGNQDMMEFMRVLPMSINDFLGEWFENPILKGALGMTGVAGLMQGPQAAGTALMFLYNAIGASEDGIEGGIRASQFVRGGMGMLSLALAAAARAYGAEIRTGAPVANILLEDDRAMGVQLANGERVTAATIISNTNPRHTFFNLVGAPQLETDFVRDVKNIKYRGSIGRINLALRELPQFTGIADNGILSGHLLLCPDLNYLERAYDDAKYGQSSQHPCLDILIPTISDPSLASDGQHLMSIDVRYLPYNLRGTDWESERPLLTERILNLLSLHAPDIKNNILHQQTITPLDYEHEYGLPEGSIHHGQMGLDQLLIMRPVAGFARYKTPIDNLYLCGSGTHPGGGVTGVPGYNAAREILKGKA